MTDRKLVVSFGDGKPRPRNAQLAIITEVKHLSWGEVVRIFSASPPVSEDKASAGWYAFAEFNPVYRDGENFVARSALTLDYDRVTMADVRAVFDSLSDLEYLAYTTASHTKEAPRVRILVPFARPVGYDEFQAISRKIAARAGIELAARESHVPSQMMFMPTVTPGATFKATHHKGQWLDLDAVLAEYTDWTDRTQWPTRKDADGVHAAAEKQTPPDEKPGIIGEFCRAYDCYEAIEKFEIPYEPTGDSDRYTYTAGSRPEGVKIYDSGAKCHSHHDSDPAHGQNNSFDLVRLHRFGHLDTGKARELPVNERPSYLAMVEFARALPEIQSAAVEDTFQDLGELTPSESMPPEHKKGAAALARRISDVLKYKTKPRWLIADFIERGVIALMAGERGSFKSFISLDWAARIVKDIDIATNEAVYVVSAEGGDYDRRFRAWWKEFGDERPVESIPLYVVERRLNLNSKEGIELIRADCQRLGIRPVLFVLDTFSKLSAGLDENDNTQVKTFIGLLDNGLKRAETAFDATVLLVAHTGHSDKTRARGASALGADTDAEYIVARDERTGVVRLTRERFKASPELGPVAYKPDVIGLDYDDDNGKPVSSVVLRIVEDQEQADRPREPRGANQRRVWEVVQEMCMGGAEVRVSAVIQKAIEGMVKPTEEGKRDRRRELAQKALGELTDEGFVYLKQDGAVVALSRVVTTPETEFDDQPHLM
jgi:hypothetical protein